MNGHPSVAPHGVPLGRFVLWSLVLVLAAVVAVPVRAANVMIDTIVVRFRDDAVPRSAPALGANKLADLGATLANSVMEAGRTRDGAFRLKFVHPVPFEEARAAVNRIRMLPEVVYASVSASEEALTRRSLAAGPGTMPQRPVTQMIVKYRDAALSAASARNEQLPSTALEKLVVAAGQPVAHGRAMSGGAWVVQLFQPMSEAEARALAATIEADPNVEYAEPDLWAYPLLVPNDTEFAANQWDLQPPATAAGGANLPGAWNITTGFSGLTVAVIDTGILPGHPDLTGKTVAGYDMITNATTANDGNGRDSDPSDPGDWEAANECFAGSGASNSSWHGTHVTGTIGAATNNSLGISGINWVSKVQAVRVLGKCGGTFSDIVDSITWAAGGAVPGAPANATPSRVINMSLGGGGACSASMQNAVTAATALGTVVVVAAGNSNTVTDNFTPANCNGVISVASVGRSGNRAYYSNYDDGTAPTYVEIAAPGGEQSFANDPNGTLSTLNAGTTVPGAYNYTYYQGTSMAAPHVAGIASLMMSTNRSLTPAQVLSKIQTSARAFPTGTVRDCTANLANVTTTVKYCGVGIIDAAAALYSAKTWDVFWRKSDGTNSTWLFNGTGPTQFSAAFPSGVPSSWTAKAMGDVNGDGILDMVWLDAATGQSAIWLMTAPATIASASFPPSVGAGSGWTLAGVGDVNGDGRADLVWRNTTSGQALVWMMSVTGTIGSTLDLGIVPLTYELRGVGDFNGDGRADLVWFRASDGVLSVWLMAANGTHTDLFPGAVGPGSWRPYRFGDFDGDGLADIFWRNESDGSTAVWYMNGGAIAATDFFTTVPLAAWQLGAARDLDLDKHADLMWVAPSTGNTVRWLMQARHVAPIVQALTGVGTGWSLIP